MTELTFQRSTGPDCTRAKKRLAGCLLDDTAGIGLTIHAHPRFDLNSQEPEREGFNRFLDLRLNRTTRFGKMVGVDDPGKPAEIPALKIETPLVQRSHSRCLNALLYTCR